MQRPQLALSKKTLDVFKANANLQGKSLSEYLAELMLIGYQYQQYRGVSLDVNDKAVFVSF